MLGSRSWVLDVSEKACSPWFFLSHSSINHVSSEKERERKFTTHLHGQKSNKYSDPKSLKCLSKALCTPICCQFFLLVFFCCIAVAASYVLIVTLHSPRAAYDSLVRKGINLGDSWKSKSKEGHTFIRSVKCYKPGSFWIQQGPLSGWDKEEKQNSTNIIPNLTSDRVNFQIIQCLSFNSQALQCPLDGQSC